MEKNEKDRDVLANLIAKTKEMMSPMASLVNEDAESREKRLIDEEENVVKGKITFSPLTMAHQSRTKTTSNKGFLFSIKYNSFKSLNVSHIQI